MNMLVCITSNAERARAYLRGHGISLRLVQIATQQWSMSGCHFECFIDPGGCGDHLIDFVKPRMGRGERMTRDFLTLDELKARAGLEAKERT